MVNMGVVHISGGLLPCRLHGRCPAGERVGLEEARRFHAKTNARPVSWVSGLVRPARSHGDRMSTGSILFGSPSDVTARCPQAVAAPRIPWARFLD